MNRQVVIEYKEEFAHWMNTGEIWAKLKNTEDWIKLYDDSKKLFRQGYEYSIDPKIKFKVGDYVRVGNNPGQIVTLKRDTLASVQLSGNRISKDINFLTKWEPQENEVCVGYNDDEDSAIILLYKKDVKQYYKKITPFIGLVPKDLANIFQREIYKNNEQKEA